MAKQTKETLMEKLMALEGKLIDLIPEDETGSSRANTLDKVSNLVALGDKAKVSDITDALNEGTGLLAVEAETKKQAKKIKETKPEENSEENEDKSDTDKPKKKVVKKRTSQKSEEKSEEIAPAPKKGYGKNNEFKFPEVLETAEDGNFKQTHITSLRDIEDGDLIACKYTKEDLAMYEYDYTGKLGQPTEFDKDVDVLIVVDAYEDKIVYAASLGTHKMYQFFENEVKSMNSSGMPWRVYKPVE